MNNLELVQQKISKLSIENQESIIELLDQCLAVDDEVQLLECPPDQSARRLSSQIAKRLLGPFVKAVLAETDEEIYAVDPQDTVVGWLLRNYGSFRRPIVKMVREALTLQSRLLIVGAHIGSTVIPLSAFCESIVAIEPNLKSFQLLEFNLHVNQVKNCRAHNIAASDKAEYVLFNMNRYDTGRSGRKGISKSKSYYDDPVEVVVPTFPLDDYLRGEAFDVILMDINGSEYFALKGMQELLRKCSELIIEFSPDQLKTISGVTVDDFLFLLRDFRKLTIPSQGKTLYREEFRSTLQHMYDNDLSDEGLLFEK